jgi:hypothetical protein
MQLRLRVASQGGCCCCCCCCTHLMGPVLLTLLPPPDRHHPNAQGELVLASTAADFGPTVGDGVEGLLMVSRPRSTGRLRLRA